MAVKKYQIFISSTLADLRNERQLATKAILDLDHIPAGMEAFPAVDMEQFEYIKKVIDECDYYVLIIGARYGSVDNDGVSYTEREFEYAVFKKIPVIALIHSDIDSLPRKNFDTDPALFEKLSAFREKVKTGRMVRMWNNGDQLTLGLIQGIQKAIQISPSPGWIRGDTAASEQILQDYVRLREAYERLRLDNEKLLASNQPKLEGLAQLGDSFHLRYRYENNQNRTIATEIILNWGSILRVVGPNFISPKGRRMIDVALKSYLYECDRSKTSVDINSQDCNTITIHLNALGILDIYSAPSVTGGLSEFIALTEKGRSELVNVTAVRTAIPVPE